jgi:hypothetical protein
MGFGERAEILRRANDLAFFTLQIQKTECEKDFAKKIFFFFFFLFRLLQVGNDSAAVVTVRGKISCAVCDGAATAAMAFGSAVEAHRFLHQTKDVLGIEEFYVVSRAGRTLLTHKMAPVVVEERVVVAVNNNKFALLLGQAEVVIEDESSTRMCLTTVRVVSLSPFLVSALVPEWFCSKRFLIDRELNCKVLHNHNGLIIASCEGSSEYGSSSKEVSIPLIFDCFLLYSLFCLVQIVIGMASSSRHSHGRVDAVRERSET